MTNVNNKELGDLRASRFASLPKATEQMGCTEPVVVTNGKQAMERTLVALFQEAFHHVQLQVDKMTQMIADC